MKIPVEDIVEIISLEISKNYTLDEIYFFCKKHPLVKNYLVNYTLNDMSELVYRVYSKVNNLDNGKLLKILKNRVLYTLIVFQNINSEVVECPDCYGSGNMDCSNCLGDGVIGCFRCDGSGVYEYDGEMIECDRCQNSGVVECPECYGDRTTDCNTCGGNGADDMGQYMEYFYTLNCDVQPENIKHDMENSEKLVNDFDKEIFDSKYRFTMNTSMYYIVRDYEVKFNRNYEGDTLFYETINPEERISNIKYNEYDT